MVGLRYGTQASRQPAAPISSSSAVDPVIAIGRAGIPQSARQQRSAACREFKASRLDCCPSSANRPVLWNRRRVIGDGLHGAVGADAGHQVVVAVDAFAGHPGAPGHSADGDGGVCLRMSRRAFDAGAHGVAAFAGVGGPSSDSPHDPPTIDGDLHRRRANLVDASCTQFNRGFRQRCCRPQTTRRWYEEPHTQQSGGQHGSSTSLSPRQ